MTDDELKALFAASTAAFSRLEKKIDDTAVETRRHFDATAERMEKRFDLLAETVQHLDEKLDREAADIRDEMRRGFADTQAMIKFSHAELDRRVRTLEDSVSDLQTRVERLETSTH